ncbi:MAG: pyridoxamine 5'-phosphate oxidase family protein [Bacteroidales bacterium]|nr:pyridoxamine 5'-phosphate oxidase family protein [Bacteroidales bacterium]
MAEFRTMRRKRQQLSDAESIAILQSATSGVLAVLGDEGYPYAVPLSYVYADGRLIFHSAVAGHKVDAIRAYTKASFCVIHQDDVQAATFTTIFRSVIVFGRIRILEDDAAKLAAIRTLAKKYSPHESAESTDLEIQKGFPHLLMFELEIEHLTGKQSKELM